MIKLRRRAGAVIVLLSIASSGAGPVQATAPTATAQSVIAAFTLVAPNGTTPSALVARAIVPGGTRCPALTTVHSGGRVKSTHMKQRVPAATTANLFNEMIACSAPIPAGAIGARVLTSVIPHAMPQRVKDIAILGDTGCRMKKGGPTGQPADIQACNDPSAWPLATTSATIASQKPDLTIFLGDFFYREIACPPEQTALCGGSPAPGAVPFKDSAMAWSADVWTPMTAALAAAPLVVVRGNHADCNRGGNGYFIYMDPREGTEKTCAPMLSASGELVAPAYDVTDPYAIDVRVNNSRDLRLVVFDGSGDDDCVTTPLLSKLETNYRKANKLAKGSGESWLLVHRPIVAWTPTDDCNPEGSWITADQQVASYGQLDNYDLLLSSHIHLVESMNIPGIPSQLVIGSGSTKLVTAGKFTLPAAGPSFDPSKAYPAPTSGWWDVRFGFGMAHPIQKKGWKVDLQDPRGAKFAACRVSKRTVDCG